MTTLKKKMRLEPACAIVTGAASGLGHHFTVQLVSSGAQVIGGDINEDGLEQLKTVCRELPGAVAHGQARCGSGSFGRRLCRRGLDVNLTGSYLMAREVIAAMLKRQIKDGIIVKTSSISHAGNPGQSNYAASKAGLDARTRTWALELAAHQICVGGIAPALVETPILARISDQARQALTESIPLQRIGTPHEIRLALQFIIECDYFTGRVIEVDGGANF